jgi:hypothetical protein
MADPFDDILWCIHRIIQMRRIKKPKHIEGCIVGELNAYCELRLILKEVRGEDSHG